MAQIPKKISELPQIQNISDDDLLLVSDYDNGKCLSRKMTMQQLVQYVIDAIASSSQVKQTIRSQAASVAQEVVTQQIDDKTMEIVEQNIDDIYDMLDGVKNSEFLIDGGGAGA